MSVRADRSGEGDAGLVRVEQALGRLLRLGVLASLAVIFVGIGVTIARNPGYLSDPAALEPLTAPQADVPHTAGRLWQGLRAGEGPAIVALGLGLLILLPILRVVSSDVLFMRRRDWAFTLLTSIVLLVLLASFLLGKAE